MPQRRASEGGYYHQKPHPATMQTSTRPPYAPADARGNRVGSWKKLSLYQSSRTRRQQAHSKEKAEKIRWRRHLRGNEDDYQKLRSRKDYQRSRISQLILRMHHQKSRLHALRFGRRRSHHQLNPSLRCHQQSRADLSSRWRILSQKDSNRLRKARHVVLNLPRRLNLLRSHQSHSAISLLSWKIQATIPPSPLSNPRSSQA